LTGLGGGPTDSEYMQEGVAGDYHDDTALASASTRV